MPYHNRLRDFLPRAGLIYPTTKYILSHKGRDARIMIAFEKAGFVKVYEGPNAATRKTIDETLADMVFTGISDHAISALISKNGGALQHLTAVKDDTPWAFKIGESVFFELFKCLVEAREAWQKNIRPPFETSQQSKTALAIDVFLSKVGSKWDGVDFQLYGLAGGWEEDDDAGGDTEAETYADLTNRMDTMDIDSNDPEVEDEPTEEEITEGVEQMNLDDPMESSPF
ncbi:hypothetical protein F5Y11DRAFT_365750 [Daldinia sp. FL1419]|nr:hypothetical protein F5Y11DRAFT_365750 [Daldinia sp. FL1419]